MANITVKQFAGIAPIVNPELLSPQSAQTAENCNLESGRIESLLNVNSVSTLTGSYLYYWKHSGATSVWVNYRDVIPSAVADDTYSRLHYLSGTTSGVLMWTRWGMASGEVATMTTPGPVCASAAEVADGGTNYAMGSGPKIDYYVIDADLKAATLNGVTCKKFSRENSVVKLYFASYSGGTTTLVINGVGTWTGTEVSIFNDVKTKTITSASGDSADTQTVRVRVNARIIGIEKDADENWMVTLDMGYDRPLDQYVSYCHTDVDSYGRESQPGHTSLAALWPAGSSLTVYFRRTTDIPTVRIYRSAGGTTQSAFFYVGQVTGNTWYKDYKPDAELAEKLTTVEVPPTIFNGLTLSAHGFAIGWYGKDVYFSEPYVYHSWPTKYRLTMDYDVVAIGVAGSDIYVLTTGDIAWLNGTHPDQLSQSKVPFAQTCVSKQSLAVLRNMLIYASPDGLCGLSGGQAQLLSSKYYSHADWQALSPTSAVGVVHDDRYMMFCTSKTVIFDFDEGLSAVTTSTVLAVDAYSDPETDKLYLLQSGNAITEWNAGATALTLKWKSRRYRFPKAVSWSAARVTISSYTGAILRLYSGETPTLVDTHTIVDGTAFRLPHLRSERVWEFEIECAGNVTECVIGTSMAEVRR